MSSSSNSTQTPPISDLYAKCGMIKNPDNSVTRIPEFYPTAAASSDPSQPVLTKDLPINPQTNTFARLYLPQREPSAAKLPLIVFIHGGGFTIGSPAITFFQKFCSGIALHLPAVVVSVSYRLAPEHRLPAAYDDCMEALHWIKTAADDEWLANHADFSKCFIMGNSAGGNAALHVGLRAVERVEELKPMRIRGVVLHQPFFGGVERTGSEVRLANNEVIPLYMTDFGWDLALPVGADRSHRYCNFRKEVLEEMGVVDKVKSEGWRFLVTSYEGDPMIDRQVEVAGILKEKGVVVVEDFREGACHGIEFYDDSYAMILYDVLKKFVLAI